VRFQANGINLLNGRVTWDASETIFDLFGSGSPEGVVTASIGSVYRRSNGSTSTTLYVKESGTGNTGWVAVGGLPLLNGFTDATPAMDDVIPIYDTSAAANRDATLAEVVGVGVEGFIQGLLLSYVSTTQIKISSGVAYIQSTGKQLRLAADSTISPSLSASTWYHLYLYDNAGTPTIESSTTAPSAPWIGTARSKTSDTTRRYLGSFRTNASSQIQNFLQTGSGSHCQFTWMVDTGSVTRALSGGTASSNTTIALANYVPSTCLNAFVRAINLGNQAIFTDTTDTTGTNPAASSGHLALGGGAQAFLFHPLNSSQEMRYAFAPAPSSGAFYLDVYGYLIGR
jgi:hypothetical protein